MEEKDTVEVQATTNLSFGEALEFLKDDEKVARAGWNGEGMFIYLSRGSYDKTKYHDPENCATHLGNSKVPIKLFHIADIDTITRMPNINMKAADGSIVTGWLASQTDMLAEDWTILD